MAFAISCGKDEGGSGGGGYASNPIFSPGVNQKTHQNLKDWFNNNGLENGISQMGSIGEFVKKTSASNTTSPTGNFNFNFCFFGIGNCDQPPVTPATDCYVKEYHHNNSSNRFKKGVPQSDVCNTTATIYEKRHNAELLEAVSGATGLVLMNIQQNGQVFDLYYGPQGAYRPTKFFRVNTGIHSMFNPVIVETTTSVKYLEYMRVIQY